MMDPAALPAPPPEIRLGLNLLGQDDGLGQQGFLIQPQDQEPVVCELALQEVVVGAGEYHVRVRRSLAGVPNVDVGMVIFPDYCDSILEPRRTMLVFLACGDSCHLFFDPAQNLPYVFVP